MTLSMFAISPDGTRWAGVAKTDDGKACVVDGEAGPSYKRIRRPAFTTDNRVVYHAFADTQYVVVDHSKGPQTAGVSQLEVGGAIAYLAETSRGFDVYVDGEVAGTFPEAGDIAVDAAGNVAFWGSTAGMSDVAKELKDKNVLYFNGEHHAVADNLGYPAISSDGVLAYLEVGTKWLVVKGEDSLGEFDWALPPRWSSDGVSVAAAVRVKDRWGLSVDGKLVGAHDEINSAYAVGPDQSYAYAALDGGAWQIVGSAGTAGPFDSVSTVHVAPDGSFAAVARRDGALYVATPDGEFGPFSKLGQADYHGGRLAFQATDEGGCRLWLDGSPVSEAYELITDPVFHGDSVVAFAHTGEGVEQIAH